MGFTHANTRSFDKSASFLLIAYNSEILTISLSSRFSNKHDVEGCEGVVSEGLGTEDSVSEGSGSGSFDGSGSLGFKHLYSQAL